MILIVSNNNNYSSKSKAIIQALAHIPCAGLPLLGRAPLVEAPGAVAASLGPNEPCGKQ